MIVVQLVAQLGSSAFGFVVASGSAVASGFAAATAAGAAECTVLDSGMWH